MILSRCGAGFLILCFLAQSALAFPLTVGPAPVTVDYTDDPGAAVMVEGVPVPLDAGQTPPRWSATVSLWIENASFGDTS